MVGALGNTTWFTLMIVDGHSIRTIVYFIQICSDGTGWTPNLLHDEAGVERDNSCEVKKRLVSGRAGIKTSPVMGMENHP